MKRESVFLDVNTVDSVVSVTAEGNSTGQVLTLLGTAIAVRLSPVSQSSGAIQYQIGGGAWQTLTGGDPIANLDISSSEAVRLRKVGGDAAVSVKVSIDTVSSSALRVGNTGIPAGFDNAVAMTIIPGYIDAQAEYNCMIQDATVYAAGYYWHVYWNSSRVPTLARRLPGSPTWETFSLGSIAGNPIASVLYDDPHNYLSIGISGDGAIHVAGNMHTEVTAIRYVKGNVATWSTAASWAAATMITTEENSITYPTFIDLGGDLLFLYRNGSSGAGSWYINRYSAATATWARVCNLFGNAGVPGGDSDSCAYVTRMVRDASGKLHIAYTWRNTGAADSNYSVFYAKSADDGVSWSTVDGVALPLPMQPTQDAGLAMATAITGSGLINNQTTGLAIDRDGNPHIAFMKLDTSNYTQIFYIRRAGGAWVNSAVTSFDYQLDVSGSILNGVMSRPDIFCSRTGRIFVMLRHNARWRGSVKLLDVTDPYAVRVGTLIDIDLYSWEPSYSQQIYQTTGRIVFMAHACAVSFTQVPAIDFEVAARWQSQVGLMVSIDPDAAVNIVSGAAKVPTITPIKAFAMGEAAVAIAVTTSPGTQVSGPGLTIEADAKRQRMVMRFSGLARKQVGGTLTINIRDNASDGSVGAVTVVQSVARIAPNAAGIPMPYQSPWVGTGYMNDTAKYSYIELFGQSSDASAATVWNCSMTLGRYSLARAAQYQT